MLTRGLLFPSIFRGSLCSMFNCDLYHCRDGNGGLQGAIRLFFGNDFKRSAAGEGIGVTARKIEHIQFPGMLFKFAVFRKRLHNLEKGEWVRMTSKPREQHKAFEVFSAACREMEQVWAKNFPALEWCAH